MPFVGRAPGARPAGVAGAAERRRRSRAVAVRARAAGTTLSSCAVVALSAFTAAGCVRPGRQDDSAGGGHWVASWSAAAQPASPGAVTADAGFRDQTIRDVLFTSTGGDVVRVRISNAYSSRALSVGAAEIALAGRGARLRAGSSHSLRFGGQRTVTIPAGADELSDPVKMRVPARRPLAVSLYLPDATGPVTDHSDAQQDNYVSGAGDFTTQGTGAAFTTTTQSWYYLDDVEVLSGARHAGTVVAFGDSITDGYRSQVNANERWPNVLARRLARANSPLAVADEGISGNRLLDDSPCFGTSALSRLDSDLLTQPAVKDVVLLEGINDIGFSADPDSGCTTPNTDVSAAQIIGADEQIIAQAHQAGIKVIGATLTPFKGAAYWTPGGEAKREAVNHWILTGGAFDATVDFAGVVADPGDPQMINPAYDSGDHLHPNDAGYNAMGKAIPLAVLR